MIRKRVAVIFGGQSGEHVVSLRSAASVMQALDPDRYTAVPVGISREGRWFTGEECWRELLECKLSGRSRPAQLVTDPSRPGLLVQKAAGDGSGWRFTPLDLVFPVLHGPFGEDGTVQGLLELAGLPYVGSGVLSSAVSMDKVIMKILFARRGLPVGPYLYFYNRDWRKRPRYWGQRVQGELGFPCFVKPANLGSSVGITRVTHPDHFMTAVATALEYDEKVIVEALIPGREVEVSVLGDCPPVASLPGEIIPCNEFYDYQAKYIDDRSVLVVPVDLGEELGRRVRDIAVRAFQAVEGSGLARVDCFVDTTAGKVTVNEINTMPGFTSISMFPKLWEASGLSYRNLVARLLELAEERFAHRRALKTVPPE